VFQNNSAAKNPKVGYAFSMIVVCSGNVTIGKTPPTLPSQYINLETSFDKYLFLMFIVNCILSSLKKLTTDKKVVRKTIKLPTKFIRTIFQGYSTQRVLVPRFTDRIMVLRLKSDSNSPKALKTNLTKSLRI